MSSLAMAVNVAMNPLGEQLDDEWIDDKTTPNNSAMSKASTQDMEMDSNEELGKHLNNFIKEKEAEAEDDPKEEDFFGGGHNFFRHPSAVADGSTSSRPPSTRLTIHLLGVYLYPSLTGTRECNGCNV